MPSLPSEFAELMVVLRGSVEDLEQSLEHINRQLEQTKQQAKAAGRAIDNALQLRRAERGAEDAAESVDDLSGEIIEAKAAAEALDDTDIHIDVERDDFGITGGGLGRRGGGGGGDDGGRGGLGRSIEQDLSRLQDELFAVFNIIRKMSPALQALLSSVILVTASFVGLNAAVGGLAAVATALATKIGDRGLRAALGRVQRVFVQLGRDFVQAFRPVIMKQVIPAAHAFANELRGAIPELRELVSNNLPELLNTITGWVDVVVDLTQVFETVVDAADLMIDTLTAFNVFLQKFASELSMAIADEFGVELTMDQLWGNMKPAWEDTMETWKESVRDLGRSLGFEPGELFLGVRITEPDNAREAEGAPTGPSIKAVERVREMRKELDAITGRVREIKGYGGLSAIMTPPEQAQARLDALRSGFEEIITLAQKPEISVKGALAKVFPDRDNLDSLKDLVESVRHSMENLVAEQARFDLENLRSSLRGVIETTEQVEQRMVKAVREARKLPGVTLETKEQIKGWLKQFDLSERQIRQIISRLRGITPLVDNIRGAFKNFLSDIGDQFGRLVAQFLTGLRSFREEALRNQIELAEMNQRMFALAEEGTPLATKKMKLLRMQAEELRKETTMLGAAWQSFVETAVQALQRLIQEIIVAIGKAAILAALNAATGGSASSIVGALSGILSSASSSGGGSAFSPGRGTTAGNGGGGQTLRLIPEPLPNGDLGWAVRQNQTRRQRLGLGA